jgi:hypothetical protein
MKGIYIKTTPNPAEPYSFEIKGSLSYDEASDMVLLCLLSLLTQSVKVFKREKDFEDEKHDLPIRAALYDKTVIKFSNIMDMFFPENKDLETISDKVKDFDDFIEKYKGEPKKND